MILIKLLLHCTIGAYVSWAFGQDEGGGWKNWKDQLLKILRGEDE